MARNRNRQPGPILRTVVPDRPTPTPGTNPALRNTAAVVVTGPGPRKGRAKGGGMVSANGRVSDWHAPANLPYSISRVTADVRWSATVNS